MNILNKIKNDFKLNKVIYLMLLPTVVYVILFKYMPMYGASIAFRRFTIGVDISNAEWVGFEHFIAFFNSYYFGRLLKNTILLNVYRIVFGFPAPIILALLINEIKNKLYKRTVQTISYIPHFVSMVVVAGILVDFTRVGGPLSELVGLFTGKSVNLLTLPHLYRGIYVASDIWKNVGYESIIYLAAILAISPSLYEAAQIDGAGRFKRLWYITLPGIAPTIIILLILRIGQMMNIGFEKTILIYNSATWETSDIIQSFVYRKGLIDGDYSYSSAIGLFNSLINFILIISANKFSKKLSGMGLW